MYIQPPTQPRPPGGGGGGGGGGNENLDRPFHTTCIYLVFIDPCPGVESSILYFLLQNYLPLGLRGHEIYSFLSAYPAEFKLPL